MDRVIERLLALLESGLVGRGINSFFNGYPNNTIAQANLPSIAVRGISMVSETLTTRRNQEVYTLQVVAIDDSQNTVNEELGQDTPERQIRKLFEERDSGNELKSDTIMSVIEKEFMYDTTYNLNCKIESIEFGMGIDPVFSTQSSKVYGIMTITVVAIPHNIKSGV